MRGGRAAVVAAAVMAAAVGSAGAAAPAGPEPRLAGQFLMAGRVTVADDIPGESVGQAVLRTWTFTAPCPAGPCRRAILTRTRGGGSDTLTLRRRGFGLYAGRGRFYAPLGCDGKTYPRGEVVPFTIEVRVIASALAGGAATATRLRAKYTNGARRNLTPCFAVLGHDAARFHGHVVAAPAPG